MTTKSKYSFQLYFGHSYGLENMATLLSVVSCRQDVRNCVSQ